MSSVDQQQVNDGDVANTKNTTDIMKEKEQQSTTAPAVSTDEENKENGQPEVDVFAKAKELLSSGKRNLACDDYPQAVEMLAEACEMLSEKFGEEGKEVAEAYFYYGKSLLELARMENGVLGNALDGVSAEEENEADLSESDQFEKASTLPDSERETIVTEVYSAMAADEKAETNDASEDSEKAREAAAKEDGATEKVNDPETEGKESAETEGKESAEEESLENDEEEGESAEDDTEEAAGSSQEEMEDADDVPNLQLAWEVLELAKRIYMKQTESEDCDTSVKVKLSEVYRVLGEVSLEAGSYEQAIQDITSCLEFESSCMDKDDRCIAETHYQLGNAHLLNRNYTEAVEQLRKSKSVIENRIANIESCQDTEGKEGREKERNELKALLPDVIAKVEDAEDESREAEKAESDVKAMLSSQGAVTTVGFGDSTSTDTPATTIATKANDISNLVRKRKPEDRGQEEIKKAKQEITSGEKENGTREVSSAGDN